MTTVRLRPTFSISTDLDVKEVIERIRSAVEENQSGLRGQFTRDHAMVSVVQSQRHFWSPWLNLEVRNQEFGQVVFGRFSPHPSIWTGFMFGYLILAVLIFFSAIAGISQLLASQWPWGFWLIPIWTTIAVVLWIASQMGQKLATAEMQLMEQVVRRAMS